MDLLEQLMQSPITLESLQRFQKAYDKKFVDDEFTGFPKVRHTYAHMGNLFGRLAKYVQMIEDRHDFSPDEIKKKVIPDLLVYSNWLADVFNVNVQEAYVDRILDNMQRLHKDKMSSAEIIELEREIEKRAKR